jgi:hypothetical protein
MGKMLGQLSESLEWCYRDVEYKALIALTHETLSCTVRNTCLGCEYRKAVESGWYCDYEEVKDEITQTEDS